MGGVRCCAWVGFLLVWLLYLQMRCCLCLVSPHDSFPVVEEVRLCVWGYGCSLVAWDGCPCEEGRSVAYGPCGCCPGVLLAGVVDDDGALAFCVSQVGGSVEFRCFQDPFSVAMACVAFAFAQLLAAVWEDPFNVPESTAFPFSPHQWY